MRLGSLLGPLLLLGCTATLGAMQSILPVPGHGVLRLDLPAPWKETRRAIPEDLPPTIEFNRSLPPEGSLQVTAMWSPKADPTFSQEPGVRALVLLSRTRILEGAVEKDLPLLPITGAQGRGFHFSATDRDFKAGPGSYPILTEGGLGAGQVVLIFTILGHAKEDVVVREALAALAKATVEPSPSVPLKTARIEVPGEGWSLTFQAPALTHQNQSAREGAFQWRANATPFVISFFVEAPAGSPTHQACFEHYWSLSRRNPTLDPASVRITQTPTFHRVQYDCRGTYQGKPYLQRNVNYYFAFRGRWMDLHVSAFNPTLEGDSLFEGFDRSLNYGPTGP